MTFLSFLTYKFYYIFKLIKREIRKGETKVSVNPLINPINAISFPTYLLTKGKVVSMEVAPPGAIAGKFPKILTIKGIKKIARSSLKKFARNAIAPISVLTSF